MGYFISLMFIYAVFALIETRYKMKPKSKKLLCFLLLLPAFLMTAFRADSVGNDTIVYLRAFNQLRTFESLSQVITYSRMEVGYVALSHLFIKFGCSYILFQAAVSGFIYFSLYKFIVKYSENIGLSCFIFLTMRMICGPMNTVRLWLAIAILLFSVDFLLNKKLVTFLLLVGLASLFHISALVFMVIYPLYHCLFLRRNKWIVIVGSIVIAMLGRAFFVVLTQITGKYESYLQSGYFNDFNKTAIYLTLAIDVCFAILLYVVSSRNKERNIDTEHGLEYLFPIIMTLILGLDIIGLTNTIMDRISDYFSVCYLLIIPSVIKRIRLNGNRTAITICILFMLALQFIIIQIYRPNWNGVIPFEWGISL